jgi:hypothetical protein
MSAPGKAGAIQPVEDRMASVRNKPRNVNLISGLSRTGACLFPGQLTFWP